MAVEGEAHGNAGHHGNAASHGSSVPAGDLKAHVSGYSLFLGLMKWGAIISFILAMLVIFIIA